MKKILLAILITTAGIKMMGDISSFACQYSLFKPASPDQEESKNESEGSKHSKHYNEDGCCDSIFEYSLFGVTALSPSSVNNQMPYLGFADQPNTPPPDSL